MRFIAPLVTITVFATACLCLAEHPIAKSDLPAAVQKTADAQSEGAKVLGYAKDVENGKTEYEVQMLVDGHTKDVTIDPEGNLLEVEEQVEPNSLSSPVLKGLAARATKGKITKIESLTKQGKLVA